MKISKTSSAKYYPENKERLQKETSKNIKNHLKKKKKNVAIWSWTLQKSLGGWKAKACWVQKKISKNEKNCFIIKSNDW